MTRRAAGTTVHGYGTAPGGYQAAWTEDDTGKHWGEPEGDPPGFGRADSMDEGKWAARGKTGVVPAWADEYLFPFEGAVK